MICSSNHCFVLLVRLYPTDVISATLMAGAMLALAHTVSDVINWFERTLGVNGAGLTVLFAVAVCVLILLLLLLDRFTKRRAIRVAHAGRYAANDPFSKRMSFPGIHRSPAHNDPSAAIDQIQIGRARDASNPRYRPETSLPDVPDPAFPTLDQVRKTAGESSRVFADLLERISNSNHKSVPAPKLTAPPIAAPAQAPVQTSIAAAAPDVHESPVAGWYHDPDGAPGDLRYWDGNNWTERRPA